MTHITSGPPVDGCDNHTHEGKPARAYNITQCRRHCLLADGKWTQAKSSKRAKQSTSSLSSNKIYDEADENNEAAHASLQTTENSAEQSGTQQSKGKRSVLLIGDSMIKAIEEQKLSKFQSVKKICSRAFLRCSTLLMTVS